MGLLSPIHLLILALVLLLLAVGFRQIRNTLRPRERLGAPPPKFLHGMNAISALALGGAMLLALALLLDVYGADWMPAAIGEDLSLGFAGSGAVLVLAALFLDRRSRGRRG